MADPNNITLKVDMDISDAESAIGKFQKTAEKAFSSSNPKLQKMGVQLTDYAHKVDNLSSKMQKLEMQKIPTDMYKEVSKEVEKLQNQYDKAKSALDKMADSKKVVPTSEYTRLQERFSWLEQQIKSTESAMKKMEQTDAFKQASSSVTKYEKQLAQLQNQASIFESKSAQGALTPNQSADYEEIKLKIDAVKQSLVDVEAQQQKLIQSGQAYKNQQAFSDHKQSLEIFNNSLDQCAREMRVLETTGQAYKNSDEFVQKKTEVDKLKASLDTAQHSKQLLESSGAGFISGADTEQYANMQAQMTGMINKYGIVNNQANELLNTESQIPESIYRSSNATSGLGRQTSQTKQQANTLLSIWNRIKSVVSKVSGLFKNSMSNSLNSYTSKHNTSFKSMLTTVLKYVFGIRSIFLLYRKLRTTISTGLTEMGKQFSAVQEDINSFKNSWATFKSSLISAFQPIYSYVVPALVTLLNYLTSVMNGIANLIAMLTGKSTYYKAIKQTKDYGDAVKDTGDSAKEASEELAEYDDLIVISQDSSSGGGSGSGSSSGDEWKWEEVKTTSTALSEDLSKIFKVFQESWNKYGKAVTDAFKGALSSIKSLLGTIWDTVVKVFTDGTGSAWVDSILLTFTDILNTVKDVATAIENAWKKNDTGEKLVKSILEMFTSINTTIGKITKSLQTAWNKNNTGETIISKILTTFTNINNTIRNLADNLGKAWDKNNVGDKILSTILDTVKSIATFIEKITSATESWSKKLDFYPLLQSIETVLTSVSGIIDSILSVATSLYTNFILPLSKKILESTLPSIIESIAGFIDDIKFAIDNIDWDSLFSTLEDIAELALDTYTEYIEKSLKEISPTIKNIGTYLGTCATALTTIKGVIDEIKTTTAYQKIKEIYDKFQQLTGFNTFKFNFANMFPGISKVVSSIDTIVTAVKTIKSVLEKNDWKAIGKSIIDGLKEGFSSESPLKYFKDKFKEFVQAVKDLLGIHSPSTVFKSIGADIIDGLKEGIKNAIKNIATWLKTNVISKITKAWDKLKTITVSLAGIALPSFTDLKDKYDAVKSKVAEITANAKEKVRNVVTNMKNTWEVIKDKTATVITTATDKVAGGISKLKETLVGIGQTFTAKIESTIDGAKEFGNTLIDKAKTKINDLINNGNPYTAEIKSKFNDAADFFTSATNSLKAKLNGIKETTATIKTSLTEDTVSGTNEKVLAYASSRIATIAKGADATVKVALDKAKSWAGKSLAEWVQSSGSVAEASVNLIKGVAKKTGKAWDSIKSFVEDISGKNTSVSATVDLATGKSWGKHNSIFSWATSADTVSNGAVSIPSKVNLTSSWTSVWGWAVGKPNYTISQLLNNPYVSYMDLWVNLKQGTNSVNFNKSAGGGTIARYGGPMASWFASGGVISNHGRTKSWWKNIPKYASGTLRAHGTMFVAGEAGPEVVGHIGARTEVLNKSQLASTMHTAIVNGMNEVMSRLGSINLNLDASSLISGLSQIPMPVVVTGQILPATEAFFSNYAGDLKSRIENVEDKLDDIVNLLASTDTSNKEEIVIQLDSRTITKIVWDNVEKRYKQTGRYSLA